MSECRRKPSNTRRSRKSPTPLSLCWRALPDSCEINQARARRPGFAKSLRAIFVRRTIDRSGNAFGLHKRKRPANAQRPECDPQKVRSDVFASLREEIAAPRRRYVGFALRSRKPNWRPEVTSRNDTNARGGSSHASLRRYITKSLQTWCARAMSNCAKRSVRSSNLLKRLWN